ncbi:MAG: type II toxin-antitoxin system VapC family toxin [Elusimicrobia bacterium]|nr:type II toxin-antitoxin system VapC family toxin [Elusimicrobiota bacterium]
MKVIDSSGWIEFAVGGPLADRYEAHLRDPSQVITPSIVVYEVYKRLKRDASEAAADAVVAEMGKTRIVPLDDALALQAADISLSLGLPMADAIVYATAQACQATIVTSDADFKGLPQVVYLHATSPR